MVVEHYPFVGNNHFYTLLEMYLLMDEQGVIDLVLELMIQQQIPKVILVDENDFLLVLNRDKFFEKISYIFLSKKKYIFRYENE